MGLKENLGRPSHTFQLRRLRREKRVVRRSAIFHFDKDKSPAPAANEINFPLRGFVPPGERPVSAHEKPERRDNLGPVAFLMGPRFCLSIEACHVSESARSASAKS